MRWVLCSSACLVCGELVLLILCMVVGNDLLTCFVVLVLGCDVEELGGIVSVWGSVMGLVYIVAYELGISIIVPFWPVSPVVKSKQPGSLQDLIWSRSLISRKK